MTIEEARGRIEKIRELAPCPRTRGNSNNGAKLANTDGPKSTCVASWAQDDCVGATVRLRGSDCPQARVIRGDIEPDSWYAPRVGETRIVYEARISADRASLRQSYRYVHGPRLRDLARGDIA